MTMLTSKNLVAFALIAIAATAFLFLGCSPKEESREAPEAVASETGAAPSRMEDPAYVAKLESSVEARDELLATRARLVAQMQAKIADAKARLGTEDEAVLKVELEKDAEWNSLYSRVEDLNKALEDERRRAMAIVRQRLIADEQKEPAAQ